MRKILDYLNTLTLRAYVGLRAALLSAVAAGAFFVPALANADIADSVVGIAVVALPLIVGESTRRKVTPAK
jgi:hypothetical protein